MASYYNDLVGWMEEEDREAEEARRQQSEKEAEQAFDNMFETPEQTLDRIFKGIWTAGGRA